MPEVDKEGFAKLEATVADAKAELRELLVRLIWLLDRDVKRLLFNKNKEESKDLKTQLAQLNAQPTTAKAGELILLTETQIETMNKKLQLLQSGQRLVTPEQREKTHRRYNVAHVRDMMMMVSVRLHWHEIERMAHEEASIYRNRWCTLAR